MTHDRMIALGIFLCVFSTVGILLLFLYTVFVSSCEKRIPIVYSPTSCRIMDAVIHGPMPSAMTDMFPRLPPENRFKSPREPFEEVFVLYSKGYQPKREFTLKQKLAGTFLCLLLCRALFCRYQRLNIGGIRKRKRNE